MLLGAEAGERTRIGGMTVLVAYFLGCLLEAANCPLFCINPETDNVAGGIGVGKCTETTEELYHYRTRLGIYNHRSHADYASTAFANVPVKLRNDVDRTISNAIIFPRQPVQASKPKPNRHKQRITQRNQHFQPAQPIQRPRRGDRSGGRCVRRSPRPWDSGRLVILLPTQTETEKRDRARGAAGKRSWESLQPAGTVPRGAGGLEAAGDSAAAVLDASRVTGLGWTKEIDDLELWG
ncbi:hypothetical protein CSOJ01_09965 [Colletotrichum sojae]|uniref:Uncharacterized protein n=1 Tax=Colletotrichum sojae TaxID=2175907 RepID=A0A8H6J1L4_9PEZI|nr:hypothetical protein CSOJ01_09965 [Colletotrichum sojae]